MFTGIIEGIGTVKSFEHFENYARIRVQCPFSLQKDKLGDSIAVDGCCLTMTAKRGRIFHADISAETLACTHLGDLKPGDRVNLERALKVGDALGGHWLQGHVDALGVIVKKEYLQAEPQPYYLIEVKLPKKLSPYLLHKGSIAIDGISLTMNAVKRQTVSLCVIPHTQEKTTLTGKNEGDRVNVEADMVLKYLEKLNRGSKK